MLTIFATPKAFRGIFDVIQRNALQSWTLLDYTELILFGNEFGTAEIAKELQCRHIPSVAVNDFGTPLVSDLFRQARHTAQSPFMAYVNADIILMDDFNRAFQRLADYGRRFLMVGQRVDVQVSERINFDPDWERRLHYLAHRTGIYHGGIDYFVFQKDLWSAMPPFAIGRFHWDNWFLYCARLRRAIVVDATAVVTAVHQNHPYGEHVAYGAESRRNRKLLGEGRTLTPWEATHILTQDGIKVRCRSCYPLCCCNPI